MENTLSRDGTSPNTMGANLDMNSNRILNLPAAASGTEPLRYMDVDVFGSVDDAAASAAAAAASETAAAASASSASASATSATASASTASTAATNASTSASSASTSATNAASSASSASTSATIATTQATNAASSASSASTSATNAASSASSASTSATNASNSASAAATSATNAATSETNAAASAARLQGTSTTSNSIGTGSKSFTTQSGKMFDAGNTLVIVSDAAPATDNMSGTVTSYSGTSLTVNIESINGSGTHTDWTIYVAGHIGATGPTGTLDFTVLVTDTIVSADVIAFGDVSDSENPNKATLQSAVDTSILANGSTFPNTGLHILDTNASHDLIIAPGSDLTADRTLTVTTGDAARTVTISGDATISQDYSTTGNPQFATIELGAATDTTLSRSSAGVIAVEGVTVPLNSTTAVHTASTIELGHASDTTLSRSAAGVLAVEGVDVTSNSTSATHIAGTIELGHASDTTLARSGAGVVTIEGVEVTTNTATQTLSNKTLTAPKIADAGFIADANGNEEIIFTTTASAVNEVTLANAATGANPQISASGSDANVGLDFQAKGTGVYNFKSTASQATEIRLFEDTDDGAHYTAFKPQAQAANITYTLPPNDGNASEVLTTDGAGSLTWTATAGSGDVTAASTFGTDNVVIRSDGTGKGVQSTGITVDDSNNVYIPGTLDLGNASDTTISRDSAGVVAVEGVALYSNMPQNSQSAAYTLVIGDAQKHIFHPTTDANARTFTIPANASVAYPIGTTITFINAINTVTISITSDTLTFAGPGTTGSRTLAANGVATAIKTASTSWIISGVGLS